MFTTTFKRVAHAALAALALNLAAQAQAEPTKVTYLLPAPPACRPSRRGSSPRKKATTRPRTWT
ncbi:hypothetical protein PspTeo4_25408 [Pseudomonas sp. Teo4]|nr:hypothetical protein [Pseudomonas sp. Teo4]